MRRYYLAIVLLLFYPNRAETHPLTSAQKREIGLKIWHNEGSQKYENLAFWNKNEPFPSFGIGHFIWYPAGVVAAYDQTFPALLDYLIAHQVKIPAWLIHAKEKGAPWQSKESFDSSPLVRELRDLLLGTIDLQASFCIERLEKSWHSIEAVATPKDKARLNRYFKQLMATPEGSFALIDYLNFKGAGTNPSERYNGIGWGLLQVMLALPKKLGTTPIIKAFADAAERILQERVVNATQEKKPHEERWLLGWKKRINRYRI